MMRINIDKLSNTNIFCHLRYLLGISCLKQFLLTENKSKFGWNTKLEVFFASIHIPSHSLLTGVIIVKDFRSQVVFEVKTRGVMRGRKDAARARYSARSARAIPPWSTVLVFSVLHLTVRITIKVEVWQNFLPIWMP